jgi:hypothetical protein
MRQAAADAVRLDPTSATSGTGSAFAASPRVLGALGSDLFQGS